MKHPLPVTLLLACLAPGAQAQVVQEGRYWVENASGSVPVAGAHRLRISTRGSVVLRGAAGDSVAFELKKRARTRTQAQAVRYFEQVQIKTKTQGEWLHLVLSGVESEGASPELQLKVPRSFKQVVLETQGGAVQADDLDGVVQAETGGGTIRMDRIAGSVIARTGGGEIRMGKIGGSLRSYSGGGSIHVESTGGEAHFETAGGEIFIREAGGLVRASTAGGNIHVERAAGAVSANTSGGLIEVVQAGGLVTAETSGGSIQIGAARGVRCESAAGAIRLKNVTGALRASTAVGSILAELLAGRTLEDSSLNTGGGDIVVFIPSNLAVTVRARNESSGRFGRIVSDFPEIRVKLADYEGPRPTVAEGALNGGGPVLQLTASGGTIYLRRLK